MVHGQLPQSPPPRAANAPNAVPEMLAAAKPVSVPANRVFAIAARIPLAAQTLLAVHAAKRVRWMRSPHPRPKLILRQAAANRVVANNRPRPLHRTRGSTGSPGDHPFRGRHPMDPTAQRKFLSQGIGIACALSWSPGHPCIRSRYH